jgi:hypothetical protein
VRPSFNGDRAEFFKIIGCMGPQPFGPDVAVNDLIGKEPASNYRIISAGLDYTDKEIGYIIPVNVTHLKLIYRPRQKGGAGVDAFIVVDR